MKLKQIAFATSLLFFSHLALGATYDVQFETSKPFDLTDNYLTTSDAPSSQDQVDQLKKDYLKIIALLKNGKLELADKKIDNLIRQYPKESNFYNLRATAEIFRKEYPQAIKTYQKAIQLSPKNLRSHLGLAAFYLQSKDYPKAKRAANKALSLDSNSIQAYFILAE
ncbi:MAG: tetratricopeptide repeat protein, partial [Methyloprofundus sp.]|nr:tetratricopeptide repeat protein [Methyloprofundus sp.]